MVEVDEAETHDEIEGNDSEVSMAEILLKDLEQVLSEFNARNSLQVRKTRSKTSSGTWQ